MSSSSPAPATEKLMYDDKKCGRLINHCGHECCGAIGHNGECWSRSCYSVQRMNWRLGAIIDVYCFEMDFHDFEVSFSPVALVTPRTPTPPVFQEIPVGTLVDLSDNAGDEVTKNLKKDTWDRNYKYVEHRAWVNYFKYGLDTYPDLKPVVEQSKPVVDDSEPIVSQLESVHEQEPLASEPVALNLNLKSISPSLEPVAQATDEEHDSPKSTTEESYKTAPEEEAYSNSCWTDAFRTAYMDGNGRQYSPGLFAQETGGLLKNSGTESPATERSRHLDPIPEEDYPDEGSKSISAFNTINSSDPSISHCDCCKCQIRAAYNWAPLSEISDMRFHRKSYEYWKGHPTGPAKLGKVTPPAASRSLLTAECGYISGIPMSSVNRSKVNPLMTKQTTEQWVTEQRGYSGLVFENSELYSTITRRLKRLIGLGNNATGITITTTSGTKPTPLAKPPSIGVRATTFTGTMSTPSIATGTFRPIAPATLTRLRYAPRFEANSFRVRGQYPAASPGTICTPFGRVRLPFATTNNVGTTFPSASGLSSANAGARFPPHVKKTTVPANAEAVAGTSTLNVAPPDYSNYPPLSKRCGANFGFNLAPPQA